VYKTKQRTSTNKECLVRCPCNS